MSAFQADPVVETLKKGERENPNGVKSKLKNRRLKVKTIKRATVSINLRWTELEILCLSDAKIELELAKYEFIYADLGKHFPRFRNRSPPQGGALVSLFKFLA